MKELDWDWIMGMLDYAVSQGWNNNDDVITFSNLKQSLADLGITYEERKFE
jgi:hypothetical protein